MYVYHEVFIHSFVDGHLGCSHVLAIVNSAAVNNGIHVCFSILVSSGYTPKSGIAGSYGGFGHLMRRVDSLGKTLMLGGIGAGEEGDDRG